MTSTFRKFLIHDATLWAVNGFGADGQPTYADPIAIKCRWDDTAMATSEVDKSTTKEDGCAVVGIKIPLRSVMLRGFEDTGTGDHDLLMEVTRYDEADDLKGRDQYREVGMMRFRGTLPNG